MKSTPFPHDRYVKKALSDIDVAKDFLKNHIPPDIIERFDLSTLSMVKESYLNDKLKLKVTDLLYKVYMKESNQESYIIVLVEHQSTPDAFMPLRMIRYQIDVMEAHKQGKILPFIYPLLFYTGRKTRKHCTDITELFGKYKDLAKHYLFKPYKLIDLNLTTNEALMMQYHLFRVVALTTKNIRIPDFLDVMEQLIPYLNELNAHDKKDLLYATLHYIYDAGIVSDKNKLQDIIIKEIKDIDEEKVMKISDQLREEGRIEGIEKGREEGIAEGREEERKVLAMNLIQMGCDIAFIEKATGLSEKTIKELKGKSN